MTIGTRIDQAINAGIIGLATGIQRIVDRVAPIHHTHRDMQTCLDRIEEEQEVLEPNQLPDELWWCACNDICHYLGDEDYE